MCSPYAPVSCGVPDARGISKKQNKKAKSCLQRFAAAVGHVVFHMPDETWEPMSRLKSEKMKAIASTGELDRFFPFWLLANFGKQSGTLRWRLSIEELRACSVTGKEQTKRNKKNNLLWFISWCRNICMGYIHSSCLLHLGQKNSDWNCNYSCVLTLLYSVSLWADWDQN